MKTYYVLKFREILDIKQFRVEAQRGVSIKIEVNSGEACLSKKFPTEEEARKYAEAKGYKEQK